MSTLSRPLLAALALSALWLAPRTALAHGGMIRVPPPPPHPPPSVRDPYAPIPPGTPTAPRSDPSRPTTPPTQPPPSAPTPPVTGDPGGAVPSRTGRGGLSGRRGAVPSTSWRDWWEVNADALRAERTIAPVTTVGAEGDDGLLARFAAARARVVAVRLHVLPTLRRLLDAKPLDDSDVRASALLALAKTSDDPDDVARLLATLREPRTRDLERESAALGLGLLRRTGADTRFDGSLLDRVRETLFETFDDDTAPIRTRCFSVLALGLLGDQPTRDDEFARDGKATVRGLWTRLQSCRGSDDLPVALLAALSLQPPRGVPSAVRDSLRTIVVTGRWENRNWGALTRAHATLAYARMECADSIVALEIVARRRGNDPVLRRSAIGAIGRVAADLPFESRRRATETLLGLAGSEDGETAGLCLVTAARIAALTAADAPITEVVAARETILSLKRLARVGALASRPYAALALGLAARPRESDDPLAAARIEALEGLRELLESERGDPDTRAAVAIAVGIARDVAAEGALLEILTRRSATSTLRAGAAAGLGLLGRRTVAIRAALTAALDEKGSDDLPREAARALGMLADASAVPGLLARLAAGGADHVLARAAVALGAIDDVAAVEPLTALALGRKSSDLARAVAAATLGLLGDPEEVASLSLLGSEAAYLARTDALHEALSLL